MKAEQLLREPERIERRIMILLGELDRIRQNLLPGGIDYSMDKVQGGGVDKYPSAMDQIMEREERIRELNHKRLWLIYERIPDLIEQIQNELARDVIRAYYCTNKTMEEVAEAVHVSYATAYRYRWMGEAEIQNILDTEK